MKSNTTTVAEYIRNLPADRQKAIKKLRQMILKNLPEGFKEEMAYGMIGYVVPHSLYPAGYHVNPAQPLPGPCFTEKLYRDLPPGFVLR